MPEPVLYMRGFPASLTDSLSTNQAVLRDLKAVASLSDEQVNAVRESLANAKGFLAPESLLQMLKNVLPKEEMAESVQRAMRSLEPGEVPTLLQSLSEQKDKKTALPTEVLERLRHVLPNLIQPYPALVRFEKAHRLASLTGQRLESLEMICDLRPIFDESRTQIEGMMPYTRLRVVATGADGLPDAFECELTRKQVAALAEQASKASQKLNMLADSIETKWLPGGLPDLPLTRAERKESKDA